MNEASNVESAPAVAVQRVVSRPHPWKTKFSAQKKLKEARHQAALRRMKRYRDDGREYFRLTEASWHKAHPNGANTGNPKFTERAIKANAAKSANAAGELRLPDGDTRKEIK